MLDHSYLNNFCLKMFKAAFLKLENPIENRKLIVVVTDEAGFDVLVNTPDTAVQSALYNEKVYVLSKAFVQTALKTPPGGLEDVIQHLYISENGSRLLSKVIDDGQRIQSNSENRAGGIIEDQDPQFEVEWRDKRISAGALVLLKRHLEWLVQHSESHGV